jgi:DNA-binding response OmpR family regulator
MILIVSGLRHESEALAALCQNRAWAHQICATVSQFARATEKSWPKVVMTRHRLPDGYSDEVVAHLSREAKGRVARAIVLAAADCSIKEEARQIALGADGVFRDPVRVEVLLELVARYRMAAASERNAEALSRSFEFAGTTVLPQERRLSRAGLNVLASTRVIELIEILHRASGQVVPYDSLYSDLFARRFTGDTANCRVLLAKADLVFRRLGVNLRKHIKVIPKSGYMYCADAAPARTRPRK